MYVLGKWMNQFEEKYPEITHVYAVFVTQEVDSVAVFDHFLDGYHSDAPITTPQ